MQATVVAPDSLVSGTRPDAGDGGDVRRGAHNPEVAGSNPAPATRSEAPSDLGRGLLHVGCARPPDQSNEPQYNPQMVRAEKITPGPVRTGTQFRSAVASGDARLKC